MWLRCIFLIVLIQADPNLAHEPRELHTTCKSGWSFCTAINTSDFSNWTTCSAANWGLEFAPGYYYWADYWPDEFLQAAAPQWTPPPGDVIIFNAMLNTIHGSSWTYNSTTITGQGIHPAKQRGQYFDGATTTYGSFNSFHLGLAFTIGTWIRSDNTSSTDQRIFSKSSSANDPAFSAYLSSTREYWLEIWKAHTSEFNLSTSSCSTSVLTAETWFYVASAVKLNSSAIQSDISLVFNGVSDKTETLPANYYFHDDSSTLVAYLGAQVSQSTGAINDNFIGFMYAVYIANSYNELGIGYQDQTACVLGSSIEVACATIDDNIASYNWDVDESALSCPACDGWFRDSDCGSCSAITGGNDLWYWCLDRECVNCIDYFLGDCEASSWLRTGDATEANGEWVCNTGFGRADITDQCDPCPIDCLTCNGHAGGAYENRIYGFWLSCSDRLVPFNGVNGVWTDYWPAAFTDDGNICTSPVHPDEDGLLWTGQFLPPFQSQWTKDYVTLVRSSAYPAIHRGQYFDASLPASMSFNPDVHLHLAFTLGFWVNADAVIGQAQSLFTKVNQSYQLVLNAEIDTSGRQSLTVTQPFTLATSQTIGANLTVSATQWEYLLYKINLASDGRGNTIEFILNGSNNGNFQFQEQFYYTDSAIAHRGTIGALPLTYNSMDKSFTGFIFAFYLYNSEIEPYHYQTQDCSNGYVKVDIACTPSYRFDELDDTGTLWDSSCNGMGCRRTGTCRSASECNYCHLWEDVDCQQCDDYWGIASCICVGDCRTWEVVTGEIENVCITCLDSNSSPISGLQSTCECNSGYRFIGLEPLVCEACDITCQSWSGPAATQCTSCKDGAEFDSFAGTWTCFDGYFAYTAGDCKVCANSCVTCSGPQDTDCNSWPNYGYVDSLGRCQNCPETSQFYNQNTQQCEDWFSDCEYCSSFDTWLTWIDVEKKVSDNGTCIYRPCDWGYFRQGADCIKCQDLCNGCIAAIQCLDWVSGSNLVDGVWSCQEELVQVDSACKARIGGSWANLWFVDSLLNLQFNKRLETPLTTDQIAVSLEGSNNIPYTFVITEIEQQLSYTIALNFTSEIPDGMILTVTLPESVLELDPIFTSIVYPLQVIEPEEDGESSAKEQADILRTIVQYTYKSMMVFGIFCGIFSGDFSQIWLAMSSLTLMAFIPLMSTDLPQQLDAVLKALLDSDIVPNFFAMMIHQNEFSKETYESANDFGYETGAFLLNGGKILSQVLIISSTSIIFAIIFFYSTNAKIKSWSNNILYSFACAFWLRALIQIYLEITIVSLIQVMYIDMQNAVAGFNSVLGILGWVLAVCTPVGVTIFIMFSKESISNQSPQYLLKYGSLVNELHIEKMYAVQYYPVFLVRRALYALNVIFLGDLLEVQFFINAVHCLFCLCFLIFIKPFRAKLVAFMSVANEVCIFVIFSISLLYGLDLGLNFTTQDIIMWIAIGIILAILFANFIALVIQQILHAVRYMLSRRRQPVKPSKASSRPKKINSEPENLKEDATETPAEDTVISTQSDTHSEHDRVIRKVPPPVMMDPMNPELEHRIPKRFGRVVGTLLQKRINVNAAAVEQPMQVNAPPEEQPQENDWYKKLRGKKTQVNISGFLNELKDSK